jgi:hypothetical protein
MHRWDRIKLSLALILILIVFSAEGSMEPSSALASDVRARIEAGQQVEFDNCVVIGDLNLSALKIDNPLHFTNTLFLGKVDCVNTTFNSDVDFLGATFNKMTDFRYTNFRGFALFGGGQFNGKAYFRWAKFNSRTWFNITKFNSTVSFCGSKFNSGAYFSGSTFREDAEFYDCKFNGLSRFDGVRFNGDADFRWAEFSPSTDFSESMFNEYAYFDNCGFSGDLKLSRARYNMLYIRWRDINNLVYDDGAYLSLIDNFKKLGYFDDADNCYYQYRDRRYDQNSGLSKLTDYISRVSCGYGVKWFNTIKTGLFILILFGIVYFLGSMPSGFWWKTEKSIILQKFLESITFSAVALLSLPKEFYPYDLAQYDNIIIGKHRVKFRILASIERLLGWSLLILFIGTLSKVMIRY